MKLKCKKCGSSIVIPPAATSTPQSRITCPGCQARYRLKPRRQTDTEATVVEGRLSTSQVASQLAQGGSPVPTGNKTSLLTDPGTTEFALLGPGEILAERYLVVRFLARGGMGEVYEAEDQELRQRVALKTIKAQEASADALIERFKREIFLARKVTHPNVCRIFDLGQHHFSLESGRPPIIFLTMELLHGETLASCLQRRHHLDTNEAHPLARQMVLALAAAHRAQVIHRDFKSENVFLVPEAEGTRVVVTDFGVARGGTQDDRFADRVTGVGVVGTPAYMAPEQVESKVITAATDIYALGIVLYEMVTGRLPFEGENPLTTAVKRLRVSPEPPRIYVPDLDPKWEETILRCLEREPENRFTTAVDVLSALEGRTAAPVATVAIAEKAPIVPEPKKARTKRRIMLELALLVVVALSAGLLLFKQDRKVDRTKLVPRRSVAVFGLQNLGDTSEASWLSTAISEMLTTELARGQALRTVPRTNVSQARKQLDPEDSAELDGSMLTRIRSLLGCDYLVAGTYLTLGPAGQQRIRLDLHLHDASLGSSLGSWSEDGEQGDLFTMVASLGSKLRERLGIGETGKSDDPLAGLPSDSQAARLYAEALDFLGGAQPQRARSNLQEAIVIERDNPLLHAALSAAWEAEGYGSNAAAEAELAFELSSHLPREDRLAIEGRYRETRGDRAGAIQSYRALWDLFPDNLEYGLRLIAAEIADGRSADARTTLSELRALPLPISGDPRIELSAASLAGLLSDLSGQLDASERAAVAAKELGNAFLIARARLSASQALRFLGRPGDAEAAAQEALEIYTSLNHPSGIALSSTNVANALYSRSSFEEAAERYRQAIEQYRAIGDRGGTASVLNNLALARKRLGDLDRAFSLYEEAASIYREVEDPRGLANAGNNLAALLIARGQLTEARTMLDQATEAWQSLGDTTGVAYGLNNTAVVLRYQGQLEASRTMHERALAIRREIGHRIGEASSLTNLALVYLDLGDLEPADALLRSALAIDDEIENPSGRGLVLASMGEVSRLRGDLEAARRSHEESLSLRRELGESLEISESRHLLAKLALDEGLFAQAEVASQQVVSAYRRESRATQQADALATQAFALLAQDRVDDAKTLVDAALALIENSEELSTRIRVELVAAALRGRHGDRSLAREALDDLDELKERARRVGLAELELRCGWAIAQIWLETGDRARSTQALDWVRSEAAIRDIQLFSHLAF